MIKIRILEFQLLLSHENCEEICRQYDANISVSKFLTFILLMQHIVSELHLTKATRNLNVPYTHAEA